MDRESWKLIVLTVRQAAGALPRRKRRPVFSDALVAMMLLWAVAHDRCMSWTCQRQNYNALFRPRRLPSVSRFTRRVRSPRIRQILQRVHERLAGGISWLEGIHYVDGLPLRIGVAGRGKVMGGFAKGYKLHVIVGSDCRIRIFSVTALNVHETHVVEAMLEALPHLRFASDALLLGDSNYDDRDLHKRIDYRGGRLFTEPRGMAEHEVTLRQMGRARREFIALWKRAPGLCRMVYRLRPRIEGILSCLTSSSGGLAPLPGYVRRIDRVTRWVGCKIILYNAKLTSRLSAYAAAA
jgi:hypothetical protein